MNGGLAWVEYSGSEPVVNYIVIVCVIVCDSNKPVLDCVMHNRMPTNCSLLSLSIYFSASACSVTRMPPHCIYCSLIPMQPDILWFLNLIERIIHSIHLPPDLCTFQVGQCASNILKIMSVFFMCLKTNLCICTGSGSRAMFVSPKSGVEKI